MGTQPENTHGIQTQTQPNPYPNFGSGSGITLGYPNFGYPIPAIILIINLDLYLVMFTLQQNVKKEVHIFLEGH